MSRKLDLVGKRFGRLVVLMENGRTPAKKTKWECKCDCGKLVTVVGGSLISGLVKSCGCYNSDVARSRAKNMVGQTINNLLVKEKINNKLYLCQCDCGEEVKVSSDALLNGAKKGCKKCFVSPKRGVKTPEARIPLHERFFYYVDKTDSCWNWKGTFRRDGYGIIVAYNKDDKAKIISSHRVSWMLHYGDIPDGMCVLHKCDNKKCVNPEHLFIGTIKDNVIDMITKGRNRPNPEKVWSTRRKIYGPKGRSPANHGAST